MPESTDPTPEAVEMAEDLRAMLNRLRRAQGQLAGVVNMLESGRDLESVVQQLKAVTGAVERAGYGLVAVQLRRKVAASGGVVDDDLLAEVERLFLTLS